MIDLMPDPARSIPPEYGDSFENHRRLQPRLSDSDYCLLRGLRTQILAFIADHVASSDVVLDYGCGAKPYLPLFPFSCHYVGIDVVPNDWADLLCAPNQPVPIHTGAADIMISTQVVYMVVDFNSYLHECCRLLKPGGMLFLTTLGTWTYHPASGNDHYRFTVGGIRHALLSNGLSPKSIRPIVGTLGAALHLRQLLLNSYLQGHGLTWLGQFANVLINCRITLEDAMTPRIASLASPVALSCIAQRTGEKANK